MEKCSREMSYIVDTNINICYYLGRGDEMAKNLRIKSARGAKDMSQKELAEVVGVARQTINAIEMGDYNPSIKLCLAICKVLDKTLDELFWENSDDEK